MEQVDHGRGMNRQRGTERERETYKGIGGLIRKAQERQLRRDIRWLLDNTDTNGSGRRDKLLDLMSGDDWRARLAASEVAAGAVNRAQPIIELLKNDDERRGDFRDRSPGLDISSGTWGELSDLLDSSLMKGAVKHDVAAELMASGLPVQYLGDRMAWVAIYFDSDVGADGLETLRGLGYEPFTDERDVTVLFEKFKRRNGRLDFLPMQDVAEEKIFGRLLEEIARAEDVDELLKLYGMVQSGFPDREMPGLVGERVLKLLLKKMEEAREYENIPEMRFIFAELISRAASDVGGVAEFIEHDSSDGELAGNLKPVLGFMSKYPVGDKGKTLAVLEAYNGFSAEEDLAGNLAALAEELGRVAEIADRFGGEGVPIGARTSIGMEYEIMDSTAEAYGEETDGDFSDDIERLAELADIKKGNDGEFEVATRPTDNPSLMIKEMELLEQAGFVDLNFRKPGYREGAHGYHMTIGGERGLDVEGMTPDLLMATCLQNILLMSGWGGINMGKHIEEVDSARSEPVRGRGKYDLEKVLDGYDEVKAAELRALSVDSFEPFQRAVLAGYYGGVAIQNMLNHGKEDAMLHGRPLMGFFDDVDGGDMDGVWHLFRHRDLVVMEGVTMDEKSKSVLLEWMDLVGGVMEDIERHNESFLMDQTVGYADADGRWVEVDEFGGERNERRFLEAIGVENSELLTAYFDENLRIETAESEGLFAYEDSDVAKLINKMTDLTNLFLKPGKQMHVEAEAEDDEDERPGEMFEDRANARAVLTNTKIGNMFEQARVDAPYRSVFDDDGKMREGYYYYQGGSEKMLIHSVQTRLLRFIENMRQICADEMGERVNEGQ